MEFRRLNVSSNQLIIQSLKDSGVAASTLLGDNREIMRHSTGALHAVLTENVAGSSGETVLSLYGARAFGEPLELLAGSFAPQDGEGSAREAATDSNQNGLYVAFTQATDDGSRGYVAHFPDPFGDPGEVRIHGPLTPPGQFEGSFAQASRAFNSVVYGWRDSAAGVIAIGVSSDGTSFPEVTTVHNAPEVVRGPSVGVHGEYVVCLYETLNQRYAPADSTVGDGAYYAWFESGDAGETWSEPRPLFPTVDELPHVVGLALKENDDLERFEIPFTGKGSASELAAQLLAWANVEDPYDSRVFAMTTLGAAAGADGGGWANSVGLLAFKDFGVGGDWSYSLTNRDMYRRGSAQEPYQGREGRFFKYSALPGTRVRVVSYVDAAPTESKLEDQVAVLVSTNKGESFDFETTFLATRLGLDKRSKVLISNSACCFADVHGDVWLDLLVGDGSEESSLVHAVLPIGLNTRGIDPTLVW